MNQVVPFGVDVGGRTIEVRPLTVRERMLLAERFAESERSKAIALSKSLSMPPKDAAEFVSARASEAERMSAFVMSLFTLEGAMAVLLKACASPSDAEAIGSALEPAAVGRIAARCLNIAVAEDSQGNA